MVPKNIYTHFVCFHVCYIWGMDWAERINCQPRVGLRLRHDLFEECIQLQLHLVARVLLQSLHLALSLTEGARAGRHRCHVQPFVCIMPKKIHVQKLLIQILDEKLCFIWPVFQINTHIEYIHVKQLRTIHA